MKSTLDTVAFFKTLRGTLESMSDKDAGRLMKCLFAYDDGESPDLTKASPVVKAIFPLVAEPLDRLTRMRMNKVRPQTNRKQTALPTKQTASAPIIIIVIIILLTKVIYAEIRKCRKRLDSLPNGRT